MKEILPMWPTLVSLWLALSGRAPRKRGSRRRSTRFRPLLEVLEDRAVPASLSYSTFLHGAVYATAVDSAGNIYVTGSTDSNLPTTPGAFETSGAGAFVAKLSATGALALIRFESDSPKSAHFRAENGLKWEKRARSDTEQIPVQNRIVAKPGALVYATYLGNGAAGWDSGYGIAVDAAGDAYMIGNNPSVPTTPNAIASSPWGSRGWEAMFAAELNPTGSALVYSTYLPGAVGYAQTQGYAGGIAVDGSGNIDVAGAAEAGFPVTAGAFQTTYGQGGTNAFFAKINPALSGTASLVYATYLGGSGGSGDAATGIALDSSGNAYLTGYTTSTNFPTTSGAFQRLYGGNIDAFVAKFNPALSGAVSLVYSTYLGGSGADGYVSDQSEPFTGPGDTNQTDGGIAVDSAGNAYVTSSTTSTNFPTTPGAFQVSSKLTWKKSKSDFPPSDAFVTKLNPTGTALVYSTYLGGGTNTFSGGAGIAVDASGNADVTGWTDSTVFPTKNPLQAKNQGGKDAFVTTLNPSGSGLLFSTYLGGSADDQAMGMALDSAGNAYVVGQTSSSNFPTTSGAYQRTAGSGFVLEIDPPADVSEVSVPIPTDGMNVAAGSAQVNSKDDFVPVRYLPSAAQVGWFTASPNPVTLGGNVTLTASNITLADPNSTITQVTLSVQSNGTSTLLGYGTQTSPGAWTRTFTVNLAPGSYTLFAQAQDSDGVFGDPFALTLQVD